MTDYRLPKKVDFPDMFCELSLPVAEATDGRLKCSVKVSGLSGLLVLNKYEGSRLPSGMLLCSGCLLASLSWLNDLD